MKIISETDYLEICVTELRKRLYQIFINHSLCPVLDWEKTEISINFFKSCLFSPYKFRTSGETYGKAQDFSFAYNLYSSRASLQLEMVEFIA